MVESPTCSAHPQEPNPTPGLSHGLPLLSQILSQIPLKVSAVCFYVLPQTCMGAGTSGVPTVPTHTSPLNRGQAKDWEVQWGCSRSEDVSVELSPEEEHPTDRGLSSQLLSGPSLPGFVLHSISRAWVDCGDTNHSRVSVCLATGTWPVVLHSVKVIKQIPS